MILSTLAAVLPTTFSFAGILYLWLAVRAARESSNNAIAYFLFLIGVMLGGTAFAFGTFDARVVGVGRVFSHFSSGFLPVALYCVYRDYTLGPPSRRGLAVLCLVPSITTLLAVTHPLHPLLWPGLETHTGVRFTDASTGEWFAKVHVPFAYGLCGYALIALAARLPTIALAHRAKVKALIVCAALPVLVGVASAWLELRPAGFPYTSLTLVALLPVFWWAGASLRIHNFSPLAYQTMLDHIRDPIIVLDNAERIVSANQPAQILLECSERDLIGRQLWQDFPEVQDMLEQSASSDLSQTVRMRRDRFFEVYSAPLTGPSGQDQGTVLVCRDVTRRKRALRALADSEHLIRSLVENSSNGILRFARDEQDGERRYRCVFANLAAERFLRAEHGTLVGMPLAKLGALEPERLAPSRPDDLDFRDALNYEIALEGEVDERWLRVVAEPVGADISVTLIDITQRKVNETRILADALRDPLTGILNRRGFEQEAAPRIAAASSGAVLYLDLNHFKSINDRFGHEAGDALLKAFGHRLEFCLRPEDVLARLGGDEFAIVLPDVSVADAKHIAERLVGTAAEAYIIQGHEIHCTASVGIALLPQHGDELWQLVSIADQAMYNVKAMPQMDAANDHDRAAYVEAAIAS